MSNPPIRLGIAGLGTVGGGVVKIVQAHGEVLAARAGRPVEITAVSARNRTIDRGVDLSPYAWVDDATTLGGRDDVDCVVEVIGGSDGPARVAVERSIDAGAHVVTANKALLAHHGTALAERAEAAGVALRYEAAVAGGIPIVKALGEGLAANAMTRVMGVLNGTCNYILTEMEKAGGDYSDVLADAQRLGYAEADPAFDVGGVDAAHKLALLAALAFGTRVDFDGVRITGIEQITLTDIEFARDLGYRIKLLGLARLGDEGLEQWMQPCMVPATSDLGVLDGVTNAVVCEGDFIGRTVYEGPGAGEGPTASAIIADVLDIARGVRTPAFGRPAASLTDAARAEEGAAPFYLRFQVADRPGVLARVAASLGEADVSIHQMRQYGRGPDGAALSIVTHVSNRKDVEKALQSVSNLDICLSTPMSIRVEQL